MSSGHGKNQTSNDSMFFHQILREEGKRRILLIFLIIVAIYSIFLTIRPYEDDESLYILTGKDIIEGNLNPFETDQNPFTYIMGSPLAPVIFGISYIFGGLIFARIIAMFAVIVSVFLTINIIKRKKGNLLIPILLVGFSACTILISSDCFLDSIALLFMMSSLFYTEKKNFFISGLFAGLAIITKFILILPFIILIIYFLMKNKQLKYPLGILVILLPFIFLYWELLPSVTGFIFWSKISEPVSTIGFSKLFGFLFEIMFCIPFATIISLRFLKKEHAHLYIFVISILLYQILTLDHTSLARHLPYAEFPAAIILSTVTFRIKRRIINLLLLSYIIFNLTTATILMTTYPSYNMFADKRGFDGNILAVNHNAFLLSKGLNLRNQNIYEYHSFEYDDVDGSSVEDYKKALDDEFFDYAFISSLSPLNYPRYQEIENAVREKYCPLHVSEKENGIDVYERCSFKP